MAILVISQPRAPVRLTRCVPGVVHPGCHHTAFPLFEFYFLYLIFLFIFLVSTRARNKGCEARSAPCCHCACPHHSICFLSPRVQGWTGCSLFCEAQAEQALRGFSSHHSLDIFFCSVLPGAWCSLVQSLPQDVTWTGSSGELQGLWAPAPEHEALGSKLGPRDVHILPSACVRLDHMLGRCGKVCVYPRAVTAIISP